jgi:hypothetical protein
VLSGAMISLWVRRWRSRVPSVNSPECVEGGFSEVRGNGVLRSSHPVSQGVIIQVWSDPSGKRAEKEESPYRSQRYT